MSPISSSSRTYLPGSLIGMLGGGQLGRMSILAGRRLGYRFRVYDPLSGGPASMVADAEINGAFDDVSALDGFASGLDVATLEFENVSQAAVEAVQRHAPVRPSGEILRLCQHRRIEKEFFREKGFPCVNFRIADTEETFRAAVDAVGLPCVAKTTAFGYDGKGQRKLSRTEDIEAAIAAFDGVEVIIEAWADFEGEFSVVCARNPQGETEVFPIAENVHRNHILHTTVVPAGLPEAAAREAIELARSIADSIGLVGILAVELFWTKAGWLINELAPRPHNSGHFTLDACLTNQFEQHIRAVCGLPLGDPQLLAPVAMVNLLGDLWAEGEPDWSVVLRHPRSKLHLYGKTTASPGRKMGHFCVLGDSPEAALEAALAIEIALRRPGV